MKNIIVFLALFVSTPAFASVDLVSLFNHYETNDINNKCSVKFEIIEDSYFLEITGSDARPSLSGRFFDQIQNNGTIELFQYDYDGEGHAYLIQDDAGMMVVMTWEDGENGFDQSTFCRLSLKNNN